METKKMKQHIAPEQFAAISRSEHGQIIDELNAAWLAISNPVNVCDDDDNMTSSIVVLDMQSRMLLQVKAEAFCLGCDECASEGEYDHAMSVQELGNFDVITECSMFNQNEPKEIITDDLKDGWQRTYYCNDTAHAIFS